jgi:hypothetical protein
MNSDFIKRVQNRVAEVAIGASTLRNQGSDDMVKRARDYLKGISLKDFVVSDEKKFRRVLNKHTNQLRRKFPAKAQKNWGAARKSLNIFLRDAFYNRYLDSRYGLSRVEQWLEVPLDSFVAKGLRRDLPALSLTKWSSVKALLKPQSDAYQQAAKVLADSQGIARVHLDLGYFRQDDAPNQKVIDSLWTDEAEARIKAYERDKIKAIPAREVLRRLRAR